MNKKTSALFAIFVCLLFVFSAGISTAVKEQNRIQSEQQVGTTDPPTETPLWLRIRNQVRDMLGYCDGSCQTLVELSGILTTEDIYFYIGDVEVHFGPMWYVTSETSSEDYDGDGSIESISDELLGLVGQDVILDGIYHSEDWFSVFTINEFVYRELGQPIWSHGKGNGGSGNGP